MSANDQNEARGQIQRKTKRLARHTVADKAVQTERQHSESESSWLCEFLNSHMDLLTQNVEIALRLLDEDDVAQKEDQKAYGDKNINSKKRNDLEPTEKKQSKSFPKTITKLKQVFHKVLKVSTDIKNMISEDIQKTTALKNILPTGAIQTMATQTQPTDSYIGFLQVLDRTKRHLPNVLESNRMKSLHNRHSTTPVTETSWAGTRTTSAVNSPRNSDEDLDKLQDYIQDNNRWLEKVLKDTLNSKSPDKENPSKKLDKSTQKHKTETGRNMKAQNGDNNLEDVIKQNGKRRRKANKEQNHDFIEGNNKPNSKTMTDIGEELKSSQVEQEAFNDPEKHNSSSEEPKRSRWITEVRASLENCEAALSNSKDDQTQENAGEKHSTQHSSDKSELPEGLSTDPGTNLMSLESNASDGMKKSIFSLSHYVSVIRSVQNRSPSTKRTKEFPLPVKAYFNFEEYFEKVVNLHSKQKDTNKEKHNNSS